jgi:hypothetical protein
MYLSHPNTYIVFRNTPCLLLNSKKFLVLRKALHWSCINPLRILIKIYLRNIKKVLILSTDCIDCIDVVYELKLYVLLLLPSRLLNHESLTNIIVTSAV